MKRKIKHKTNEHAKIQINIGFFVIVLALSLIIWL